MWCRGRRSLLGVLGGHVRLGRAWRPCCGPSRGALERVAAHGDLAASPEHSVARRSHDIGVVLAW